VPTIAVWTALPICWGVTTQVDSGSAIYLDSQLRRGLGRAITDLNHAGHRTHDSRDLSAQLVQGVDIWTLDNHVDILTTTDS